MFESRHQPLISRRAFAARLARNFGWGLVLSGLALGIGMCGYHFLAPMGWVDAFVNAAMILSGMGPVSTLDNAVAKIFAGVYALFSGLMFVGVMVLILTPLVHRFLHKFHLATDDDGKRAR